jgi:nucleotide-binding universal stress UspA family protein
MADAPFRKILVPLDSSTLSAGILPWVSSFAKRLGAELELITVIGDDDEPVGSLIDRGQLVEFQVNGSKPQSELRHEFDATLVAVGDRLPDRAASRLERIAAGVRRSGVGAGTSVLHGDPPAEIIRAAHETGCDMIAMSTHGRVGIGRGLLGSTTDRVVHAADLPMLIVRPDSIEPSERLHSRFPAVVLAALDGSKLAEGCIGPAAAIAERVGGDLRLVRAYEPPVAGVSVDAPYGELELTRRHLREEAQQYLDRKAAGLREEGITVALDVVAGPADRALVKLSRRWPASLLVIGTRGRSGLTRWVLGSVTDKVIRSSGRPVLVIPPKFS